MGRNLHGIPAQVLQYYIKWHICTWIRSCTRLLDLIFEHTGIPHFVVKQVFYCHVSFNCTCHLSGLFLKVGPSCREQCCQCWVLECLDLPHIFMRTSPQLPLYLCQSNCNCPLRYSLMSLQCLVLMCGLLFLMIFPFGTVWEKPLCKVPPHLHWHYGHHCLALPGEDIETLHLLTVYSWLNVVVNVLDPADSFYTLKQVSLKAKQQLCMFAPATASDIVS